MLVRDIYNKVLALIDRFTEDGVAVAEADNIDVEKKVIVFVDMAQKELWNLNKNTKQIELANKPAENRLGQSSNFELVDFEGETQYYPDENGVDNVQGYSVQVNGDCTITIQELIGSVWTDLVTLTPTGITTMTTYKGVLAVSSTDNPVRMVIDGSTHFLHQNRALWKFLYQADKVPTYEPWVKYDLPDDFNLVDMVVEEFPYAEYAQTNNYKIENYREFYYSFFYNGEIRITYKPIATTVTDLEDELQIDEALAQSIVYDVAAKLGFYENTDLVNWAEGRRIESKSDASLDNVPSAEEIVNSYTF